MNTYCNKCGSCGGDPCSCGCKPAKYGCGFNIMANPFDPSVWNVTINGATTRVKIPKINETDTKLSVDYTSSSLIYNAERHTDIISGSQLGSIIRVEDLRDTETANADSCDIMVFDPGCSDCGDGCKPKAARWRNYHIPDAEDCIIELDDDGYYKVLIKDECGCIRECRLPAKPANEDKIIYLRDSTPDDPDYPWYYGIYNETINLYLEQNVPNWFGKYDLEVTVNYDVQVILSHHCENTNFRSLVVPCVEGQQGDAAYDSSILQAQSTWEDIIPPMRGTPWGTVTLRSSLTFIVPKGKEAYLHHEFRILTADSVPYYKRNATYDGRKVPDSESGLNQPLWPASRLNALQVIIEPTQGSTDFDPAKDTVRDQLDAPEDDYPQPY